MLTSREREIVNLLAQGHGEKEIARMLGIAVATLYVHISNVKAKTGAQSSIQLAVKAATGTLHA